ncbi:MAG: 2-octaprenyl-6-methoxyphenyl hydroxylase [Sulfuricaulis sp.]|uniref:2-octaprenyl-6-methoxyphenyl hydroxylase n=1 Tax=Sulfuricaulis sp. TaxID=2003553 RepID=UPI0025F6FD88|nr:2-octaprenyl-6-methoxyphenyl hydroxylase [Sulfuricaulis sp.]MCR4346047.1 2-octaprenyl-6-methoxyphenyl hydroxylase [Sulfuricaulis sp.]
MKTDFDILIIGGGLVGASLAVALRESPLRIGVIEAVPLAASSQPSYDDRTLALAYGSKQIFDSIGCWRDIAPEATPIDRIHISDRGHFGVTRLSAVESGMPALGYVVANRALGAVLLKAMQASKNIEWLCPAEMREISIEGELATVVIEGVPSPLTGEGQDGGGKNRAHASLHPHPNPPPSRGREKTLRARLVIAADGAHSAVRAALGIEAERTEYCQSAIVSTVTAGEPHGNTAYERFTDTGPLALLPLTDNRCAVVWSANAEEVPAITGWSDTEFLAQLQDRFGDRLGVFTRLGKRTAYPLMLTRVKEQVRERLALIGNAAHTVHPVAGQGFNLGLRDVAVMAEILTDTLRRGEDIGGLTALRRYADWRVRDNRVTAGFTNGLIRIFSNNAFPLTFVRNAGLIAVDLLPGVKRRFVRVTSGLAGRLPRLARGLPL